MRSFRHRSRVQGEPRSFPPGSDRSHPLRFVLPRRDQDRSFSRQWNDPIACDCFSRAWPRPLAKRVSPPSPHRRGRGQLASTVVTSPPLGVNSPRTTHVLGRAARTMSRKIRFTAFS